MWKCMYNIKEKRERELASLFVLMARHKGDILRCRLENGSRHRVIKTDVCSCCLVRGVLSRRTLVGKNEPK